ncbi:MAG: HAMP domain-containing protein [Bernardetiaceae bacterium]
MKKGGRKKSRVAFELLLWFLLIEFPAESLLVYVSYYSARTTLEQELTEKFQSIATRQAAQIDDYLASEARQIENLAQLPVLRKPDSAVDLRAYDPLFLHFAHFLWVSPSGEVLYSIQDSSGSEVWKGRQLAQSDASLARLFSRTRTIFQTEFSDVIFDVQAHRLLAYVATPLRSPEGRELGVLIGQVRYSAIRQVMDNYTGLGKTGESLLVIREGEQARFLNPLRGRSQNFEVLPLSVSQTPILWEVLSAKTGFGIQVDFSEEEVFAYWAYVPSIRAGLVVRMDTREAFAPIVRLRWLLLLIILMTLVVVVMAAFSAARTFTRPIRLLTQATQRFSAGDMQARADIRSRNEIGILADSFNQMAQKIQSSQQQLAQQNQDLERKVGERTEELLTMNEELRQSQEETSALLDFTQEQKQLLEAKNQDIMSSIRYAERIQEAILPKMSQIEKFFGGAIFVFFRPRDVVSGDFYWFRSDPTHPEVAWLAAVDCTGHGVPGAFMSILSSAALDAVSEGEDDPSRVLEKLHWRILYLLEKDGQHLRDGMDIALCRIDKNAQEIRFAGARQNFCYVQDGQMRRIRGDRRSIGETITDSVPFTQHILDISQHPTTVYLFSDGYPDQIGGSKKRKLLTKNFIRLLEKNSYRPLPEQAQHLEQSLQDHQGDCEQVDDILVIGFQLKP